MEASKRISAIQENIGKVMIGSQTVVRLLFDGVHRRRPQF